MQVGTNDWGGGRAGGNTTITMMETWAYITFQLSFIYTAFPSDMIQLKEFTLSPIHSTVLLHFSALSISSHDKQLSKINQNM